MNTYQEIQKKSSEKLGLRPSSIKTCWISEVKREKGLTRGHSHNYGKGIGASPCPEHIKIVLKDII